MRRGRTLAPPAAEFLLAQTLPSVEEALGIARARTNTGKPYLISFCTGIDGHVLDGTPLPDAMARIEHLERLTIATDPLSPLSDPSNDALNRSGSKANS